MSTHRNRILAIALAALSATAFAQSSSTTTTTTTPDSTVGVTPSEAKEAMQKAVPRSDTATVIRTDESAADKARRAGNAAADAVTPGRDASGSGSTSSTTGSGAAMGSSSTMGTGTGSHTMRAARADRN
jgi:hypothetical protein